MTISVIICTYQRPESVRALLAALTRQTVPPAQTLVVDASTDARTAAVVTAVVGAGQLPGLTHVAVSAAQRGLTRQRNYGIAWLLGALNADHQPLTPDARHLTPDIIAFLDDDTEPEPNCFAQMSACFTRHPTAVGVGGYLTDAERHWQRLGSPSQQPPAGSFRWGDWVRPEDRRWRLRRAFGLVPATPPGWVPPAGHGRSTSFLPPDGQDYRVETLIGAAFAFRRELLAACRFSEYFSGYGLYEDLDFCVRACRLGPLYLCTRARVAHHHVAAGRPHAFRYGTMVARNGWYVWRQRWPHPGLGDRCRWWCVTLLLTLCRAANVFSATPRVAGAEALGRLWGALGVLIRPPRPEDTSRARVG